MKEAALPCMEIWRISEDLSAVGKGMRCDEMENVDDGVVMVVSIGEVQYPLPSPLKVHVCDHR